jgi:hypothetical protein
VVSWAQVAAAATPWSRDTSLYGALVW